MQPSYEDCTGIRKSSVIVDKTNKAIVDIRLRPRCAITQTSRPIILIQRLQSISDPAKIVDLVTP